MQRNQNLDALRGFAILAMVLSGSIAFGILPAWMYHAQEPPPSHVFIPTLPGISWVDLVFPFFLFSMGAAIPLALQKKEKEGAHFFSIFLIAGRRFLLLLFFALFTNHFKLSSLSKDPQWSDCILSVFAFVLLFFELYRPTSKNNLLVWKIFRYLAFGISIFLLVFLPFSEGNGFSFYHIDIILLILANMAFWGAILWWLTRKHLWVRVLVLLLLAALLTGADEDGSWNKMFVDWSPAPWMYQFHYLKYLFIIAPGTLVGEWMLQYPQPAIGATGKVRVVIVSLLSFLLIIINVALLFNRHMVHNLAFTAVLLTGIGLCLRKMNKEENQLMIHFFVAGSALLVLGLFAESFQGGIKKDPATFSYFLVSSGLAFFMLLVLNGIQLFKPGKVIVNYLSLNGKNPMVAYVAGGLLLLPILRLTGGIKILQQMHQTPWAGFLAGVFFTGIVSVVTVFFTKKKWFWKT